MTGNEASKTKGQDMRTIERIYYWHSKASGVSGKIIAFNLRAAKERLRAQIGTLRHIEWWF